MDTSKVELTRTETDDNEKRTCALINRRNGRRGTGEYISVKLIGPHLEGLC